MDPRVRGHTYELKGATSGKYVFTAVSEFGVRGCPTLLPLFAHGTFQDCSE